MEFFVINHVGFRQHGLIFSPFLSCLFKFLITFDIKSLEFLLG